MTATAETFRLSDFDYDATHARLGAYVSALGLSWELPRQIDVENPRTGRTVSFVFEGSPEDSDGEWTVYRPAPDSETVPGLKLVLWHA